MPTHQWRGFCLARKARILHGKCWLESFVFWIL